MTRFYNDFEHLMKKGYYVYVESDSEDGNINLEARNPADDSEVITAVYTNEGELISYNRTNFIQQVKAMLNPCRK